MTATTGPSRPTAQRRHATLAAVHTPDVNPRADALCTWIVVISLTLLGAWLRWGFLDHPMRYDESFNYLRFSSRGPWHVVTHFSATNNHVLHTWLTALASHLFGTSPAGLRAPAFLAGVLLIPVTAWAGWALFRRRFVMVVAAATVCASSPLIEYSTNARGYSLLALIATVFVVVTVRLLRSTLQADSVGTRRAWIGWGLIGAAGIYTIPVMIYPVIALFVAACLLIVVRHASRSEPSAVRTFLFGPLLGLGVCAGATLLAYSPILIVEGPAVVLSAAQNAANVARDQFDTAAAMIGDTASLWVRHAHPIMIAAFVCGMGWFVVTAIRRRTPDFVVPIALLVGPLLMVWMQRSVVPPRVWLFALPVAILCASHGLGELVGAAGSVRGRRVLASVAMGIVGVGAVLSGWSVTQQSYLTTEPNTIVDVPAILDECQSFGMDRCALLMRYTPATGYYLARRGTNPPLPSDHPDVQRVYIAADRLRPLASLWRGDLPAFSRFTPPRKVRDLARCTLYVADLAQESASRTLDKPTTTDAG